MMHPFESAGLGKAPFHYEGMTIEVCGGPNAAGVQVGYAGQPAGTCQYCGMGIKYVCHIRSADGRRFKVGSDCVMKLDRSSNAPLVAAVDNAKKALERKKRQEKRNAETARESARIEAARSALPAVRGVLAAQPHPVRPGDSLADYVEWLLSHAGHSGKLRAARIIETA